MHSLTEVFINDLASKRCTGLCPQIQLWQKCWLDLVDFRSCYARDVL